MNALILVACLGIVAMMSDILRLKNAMLPIIGLGLAAAGTLLVLDWDTHVRWYSDMMFIDNYAIAFGTLLITISLLWLVMSKSYFLSPSSRSEHAALMLFSLCGGLIMVSYADLTMLFIGIEILSVSFYVLASSRKDDVRSNEAGLKYFLLGAFATGFLLFGMALIYGAAGSFNLSAIADYMFKTHGHAPSFIYVGILLMMIGLLFKISAFPFHFWAPDVYEGAPTAVTTLMATLVKTAAFAAFYRLFSTCFNDLSLWWSETLAVLAALTMLVGNILAVLQQSFKRMLAYSSIAHAGYMLMAIVMMNEVSAGALFLYAAAYSIASLGSFSCLQMMSHGGSEKLTRFRGLAFERPGMAILLSIIMLSLAGIPPVAGFFAKYYLFTGAISGGFTWLVLVAVLSSLIGVYYYLRVVYTLFLPREIEDGQIPQAEIGESMVLLVATALTLAMGIWPAFLQGLF